METIKFNKEELMLVWSTYATSQQIKLQLFNKEGPYLTATKEVEHVELEEDELIIKDYNENENLLQILIKEEIIAKPHENIKLAFGNKLHICQIIK